MSQIWSIFPLICYFMYFRTSGWPYTASIGQYVNNFNISTIYNMNFAFLRWHFNWHSFTFFNLLIWLYVLMHVCIMRLLNRFKTFTNTLNIRNNYKLNNNNSKRWREYMSNSAFKYNICAYVKTYVYIIYSIDYRNKIIDTTAARSAGNAKLKGITKFLFYLY